MKLQTRVRRLAKASRKIHSLPHPVGCQTCACHRAEDVEDGYSEQYREEKAEHLSTISAHKTIAPSQIEIPLTVMAPLAAKLQPRAHHPEPFISSALFPLLSLTESNDSPLTSSPSEKPGGDNDREVLASGRYSPATFGFRVCDGGGILCSKAISCAVAADVLY